MVPPHSAIATRGLRRMMHGQKSIIDLRTGDTLDSSTSVAIVGAGPYGLSLATQLERRGVRFRIFGPPMQVWRKQMPEGMRLKSDGFASDLYDPDRTSTLQRYCRQHGIPYADNGVPVDLDTFVAYAMDFQRRIVPMLEPESVTAIRKIGESFNVALEHGQSITARSVVMATGVSFFDYMPDVLSALPIEVCTHSSAHHDLSGFRHRRVIVIGGGASATDLAALLRSGGASVQIVTRTPLTFHSPPDCKPRSVWQRFSAPNLGLGPGLKSAAYTAAPGLFHALPRRLRLRIVRRHLGPSGGWFMKNEIIDKLPVHEGYEISRAQARQSVVILRLVNRENHTLDVEADHIICATGYHVSTARLRILDQHLRSEIKLEAQSPILSRTFESSVPGLYFIGVTSANSFGPVMRFARGAEYTAKRLGAHLAGLYSQHSLESHANAASS